MTDRHPGEEVLLDLALSDLDDHRGDDLAVHLSGCESCRVRYAAIVDAVDHVLAAAPRVDPPAGFSRSVLAAMGLGTGSGSGAVTSSPRWWARGRRPRVALVVAAAAAVGLLVGAGGAVVVLQAGTASTQEVLAAGSPLVTGSGTSVGAVQVSRHDGQPVLVVTVTGGVAGAYYECRLVLADGTSRPAGSWALDPAGGGTWVITRPQDAQVVGVEMVTDTGNTWATATI